MQVRAEVTASLNGRESRPLVDPGADLADQERTLTLSPWISPLEEPLRAGGAASRRGR